LIELTGVNLTAVGVVHSAHCAIEEYPVVLVEYVFEKMELHGSVLEIQRLFNVLTIPKREVSTLVARVIDGLKDLVREFQRVILLCLCARHYTISRMR